ncbi:MAG: homocysteine S-methyltransferase family protein [Steroidobacteraceae bacterium]
MEKRPIRKSLLQRLQDGFVLCGEGYVFELERRGYVKSGPYVPEVVLDFPEAVLELHREYVRAGSDVVLALTYYAHRDKMKVVNRERDAEELNRQAVRLAKKVAEETGSMLAGNICNTWVYNPKDHARTSRQVRKMYEEQVGWAVEEGAEFIIAETLDWFAEASIALEVIQSYKVPAVINFLSVQNKTSDGFDYPNACQIMSDRGAAVVGLNCGRGPPTMLPMLKRVVQAVNGKSYVAALPVAYRTSAKSPSFITLRHRRCEHGFPVELEPFQLTRYEMANFGVQARDLGVRFVGICCGGAPHQLRAMAEALGRTVQASEYSPVLERHAIMGSARFARAKDRNRYRSERKLMRGRA